MKFLFLLFIIWWVIFMTILPIKRSDFEESMPKKSYLGIKFLVSFGSHFPQLPSALGTPIEDPHPKIVNLIIYK